MRAESSFAGRSATGAAGAAHTEARSDAFQEAAVTLAFTRGSHDVIEVGGDDLSPAEYSSAGDEQRGRVRSAGTRHHEGRCGQCLLAEGIAQRISEGVAQASFKGAGTARVRPVVCRGNAHGASLMHDWSGTGSKEPGSAEEQLPPVFPGLLGAVDRDLGAVDLDDQLTRTRETQLFARERLGVFVRLDPAKQAGQFGVVVAQLLDLDRQGPLLFSQLVRPRRSLRGGVDEQPDQHEREHEHDVRRTEGGETSGHELEFRAHRAGRPA